MGDPAMHRTLVDCATLRGLLERSDVAVIDCRFDLADSETGKRAYTQAHIPGAVYAHLDHDLSGPRHAGSGRHPLPSPDRLKGTFGRWGITTGTQVIAYDDAGGMLAAARMWWLLRYLGHEAAAVLDGGWAAWRAAGMPVASGVQTRQTASFRGEPRSERAATADEAARVARLIDSRDPARYRGEHEPIDPVAGHIPGALNHFCADNLDANGRFRGPVALRAGFADVYAGVSPDSVTFYCGSGVTACHNLLAVAHTGLPPAKLYAGSWSDWCSAPERPVATGAEPGCF